MDIPLSVLDLSPVDKGSNSREALQNTLRLAQLADSLGYTRYWVAEHHNSTMTASSTPELLIGYIAQATKHIRVGSGGMMLPNHSALKVAEVFRFLETMHPGRIDLGIGRAPGTDPKTALALRRFREALGADDFPGQLMELFAFVGEHGGFPPMHPFKTVQAIPSDVSLPPIWLLGSSDYSAQVAAVMGLGFSFAHHINPSLAIPAIEFYRTNFKPSGRLEKPHVILTVSVVCADTDQRAEELARSMGLAWVRLVGGRSGPILSPEEAKAHTYTEAEQAIVNDHLAKQCIGTPATIHQRLLDLIAQTQADELMITSMMYGYENRARSYELLAEAFELQRVGLPPKHMELTPTF